MNRRLALAAAIVAVAVLGVDLSRPPGSQVTARALLGGIDVYQATLSPRLAALGARCRFRPTCSHYAEASIRQHGALGGSWRTLRRLARCGPWTPLDTYDPP